MIRNSFRGLTGQCLSIGQCIRHSSRKKIPKKNVRVFRKSSPTLEAGIRSPAKEPTADELFKPVSVLPDTGNVGEADIGEEIAGKLTKGDRVNVLKLFTMDSTAEMLAGQHGITGKIYEKAMQSFRKYCITSVHLPVEMHVVFFDIVSNAGHATDLFPFFLGHAKSVYPHLDCMEDLQKISDLTEPSQWYPLARSMERKIIFHAGPTNSGKTYHALKRFMECNSGVYCGPLRLLAMEVFDKCNTEGVPCDLITGETRCFANEDETPATHMACTVEMTNLSLEYEVAVIDEIQMIGDLQRGWSWSRTLLGLAAKEVHLCGEETAIDLVKNLMLTIGDPVEVRTYDRLTSLSYIDKAVGSFDGISDGDCIVCFSKKDIYKVFNVLIAKGHKCAIIYGNLPPGTKIMQARKFNDPDDPCGVLVATDAVGMGLNLSIKRVIFYSLSKHTLREDHTIGVEALSTSQVQQIGGRAGRFRTQYEDGQVTTFWEKDLQQLQAIVSKEKAPLEKAGMNPTAEMIEMFSYHLPRASLSDLLDIFIHVCKMDDMYFMCNLMQFQELARLIEHIPLPLKTRYTLCSSPLKVRQGYAQTLFVKIAGRMSHGLPLTFDWFCTILGAPFSIPKSVAELTQLEAAFEVVDIYLWLSYRYPDLFVDTDEVRELRVKLDAIIQTFLNRGRITDRKRRATDFSQMFDDQKHTDEVVEEYLIQNNPLQAYKPKSRQKKDSEKQTAFRDAYKDLNKMEWEILEPKQTATRSFWTDEGIRDPAVDIEMQDSCNSIQDNAADITTFDKADILNKQGFFSKSNKQYNEIAGSYKIKNMFQKEMKSQEVLKKDVKLDSEILGNDTVELDSNLIGNDTVTNVGEDKILKTGDETSVQEITDFSVSPDNKGVESQATETVQFGMGTDELDQIKQTLTDMKQKKLNIHKNKPTEDEIIDKEEMMKFVHVYRKRKTDSIRMSVSKDLHEHGKYDSGLSFAERFAKLNDRNQGSISSVKRSIQQTENTEQNSEGGGNKVTGDGFSVEYNIDLINNDHKTSAVTEHSSEASHDLYEKSRMEHTVRTMQKSHDHMQSICENTVGNIQDEKVIDESQDNSISLTEQLVNAGVLSEEILEQLKSEWAKNTYVANKHDKASTENGEKR